MDPPLDKWQQKRVKTHKSADFNMFLHILAYFGLFRHFLPILAHSGRFGFILAYSALLSPGSPELD